MSRPPRPATAADIEALFGVQPGSTPAEAGLFSNPSAPGDGLLCTIPGCPELLPGSVVVETLRVPEFRGQRRNQGLMWTILDSVWRALWYGWAFLRQVSGDDAYERYLDHMTRFHGGIAVMSRGAYYEFRLNQKWERISRCC